ncbi:hypothetical protein C8Q80DRAFT_1168796 [Daedaleopsis nitida]|nr:hypothetical protein C8Q80DRAFT_1168796 [Daedaleopsis nitida]
MPLRRRSTVPYRGNLCYPNQTGTWAYSNYYYNYGPPPPPLSPTYLQSLPGPSTQPSAASQHAVVSPEDDVQRLFNVCKVGRGNAELLQEVLIYAKPQELKNEITKELLGRARASHELIGSQIPWATTEAERSRRVAGPAAETVQEQLLATLLSTYEQLAECLRMHEDLERIAIEQEAEERMKTERLIQALTAVSEYRPAPEEGPLIEWVLSTGDPEYTGKINPQTATRIFSASNLPPDALARIWEIASVDSKDGLLDRQGVGVALRLIGYAQGGAPVTEALVKRPGPRAVLENISPLPTSPTAGPSTAFEELPPLSSHDLAKFKRIFKTSRAQNGILSGEHAREVFMKSKLPWSTLSEIWALADVRRRGFLDVSDFTIAMYLIQALMTGRLTSVPTALPLKLYEEAARQTSTSTPPDALPYRRPSPRHPTHPSTAAYASPFSGPPPPRHPSRSPSQLPSPSWDVSPATKVQANHLFSTMDPQNQGYATAEAVCAYIHQAGLSRNATSRIWDMVDIGRKGYLTRDEFTMAMHLVKMRKDGHKLPNSLPSGVLSTSGPSRDNDAYAGIADETPRHLDPYRNTSRPSLSHNASRGDSGPSRGTSDSSALRPSRSSSHLPALAPIIAYPSSPNTPAPFPIPAHWNIKLEDRIRYDRYFDQLDTYRKGYLLSDVAVPFFARAKLPNDVMATIWDLADSEHDGRITRDDFAVAMHLIRQKLAGRDFPTATAMLPSVPIPSPPTEPPSTHRRDSGRPSLIETPSVRSSTSSRRDPPLDPATVRLPDDADDGIRSDTPPPPYELIASGAT